MPKLHQIQVNHPLRGWIWVGRPSKDKAALQSWRGFVKAAWHGLPIRIRERTK